MEDKYDSSKVSSHQEQSRMKKDFGYRVNNHGSVQNVMLFYVVVKNYMALIWRILVYHMYVCVCSNPFMLTRRLRQLRVSREFACA